LSVIEEEHERTGRMLERVYGDRVLAELPATWPPDELHELTLSCRGALVRATCDGKPLLPVPVPVRLLGVTLSGLAVAQPMPAIAEPDAPGAQRQGAFEF